jgi:hypothetical protein
MAMEAHLPMPAGLEEGSAAWALWCAPGNAERLEQFVSEPKYVEQVGSY